MALSKSGDDQLTGQHQFHLLPSLTEEQHVQLTDQLPPVNSNLDSVNKIDRSFFLFHLLVIYVYFYKILHFRSQLMTANLETWTSLVRKEENYVKTIWLSKWRMNSGKIFDV